MGIVFRPTRLDEIEIAVPLIYSVDPDFFEYCFTQGGTTSMDFLRFAYGDGRGFFGWGRQCAAEVDGVLGGLGLFYDHREYQRLSNQLAWQVLRFFGLTTIPRVVLRLLSTTALMPPPSPGMHFVANLGVRSELQGRGVGTALLEHQMDVGRSLGRTIFALDVSAANPRGQALYERLGLRVVSERAFRHPEILHNQRRMEMALAR